MTETEMSRVEKAREAAQKLTDNEFADHRRWCAIDEQQRRERELGARAAETDLFRKMRDQGMIPAPPEVWEPASPPMIIWLPGDECKHEDQRWVHVGVHHTTQEPGAGDHWQQVPEEMADGGDHQ